MPNHDTLSSHASSASLELNKCNAAGMDLGASVIEYARSIGLSSDHTRLSPLHIHIPPSITRNFIHEIEIDIPLLAEHTTSSEKETLQLSYYSANLLRSVTLDTYSVPCSEADLRKSSQCLRLGSVLLQVDPDLDYHDWLRHRYASRSDVLAAARTIPQAHDIYPDSLLWPLGDVDLSEEVTMLVAGEKLPITRGSLALLAAVMRPQHTIAETEDLTPRARPPKLEVPLLPASPSLLVQNADPSAIMLDRHSSPIDIAAKFLQDMDQDIAASQITETCTGSERDGCIVEHVWDLTSIPDLIHSPGPSPRKRKIQANIRLPSPLLPHEHSSPPFKRTRVSDLCRSPPFAKATFSETSQDREYFQVFNDWIDCQAREIGKQILHEELVESDTSLRMHVPLVPETQISTPWQEAGSRSRSYSNKRIASFMHQCKQVPASMAFVDVQRHAARLSWLPVPIVDTSRITQETLDSLQSVQEYLELDVVNYANFSWKTDGLRILDRDEATDDLVFADIDTHDSGFASFLEEYQLFGTTSEHNPADMTAADSLAGCDLQVDELSALDEFFDMQDGQVAKTSCTSASRDIGHAHASDGSNLVVDNVPRTVEVQVPIVLSIDKSHGPAVIIISTAILQNRHLTAALRTQLSETFFIERDHAESEDADIIATPITGLVLTNMQKLRQRPLPGSRDRLNKVHARLLALACKYEHLTVLVSCPSTSTMPIERSLLGASDIEALHAIEGLAEAGTRNGVECLASITAVLVSVTCPVDLQAGCIAREICVAVRRDMGGAVDHSRTLLASLAEVDVSDEELRLATAGFNGLAALLVAQLFRKDLIVDPVNDLAGWVGRRAAERILGATHDARVPVESSANTHL